MPDGYGSSALPSSSGAIILYETSTPASVTVSSPDSSVRLSMTTKTTRPTLAPHEMSQRFPTSTPTRPHPPRIAIEPAGLKDTPPEDETAIDPAEAQAGTADLTPDNAETGQPRALIAGLNWPRAELLTWIRETRRMRSEEVHFLDAPTLGVLIFFKKIEPEDAAPLIRKLGLTGDQEPEESQEAP